jgi:hypothetical protein
MHTSATPRERSSDSTDIQNFADSPVVGPTHRPAGSRGALSTIRQLIVVARCPSVQIPVTLTLYQ